MRYYQITVSWFSGEKRCVSLLRMRTINWKPYCPESIYAFQWIFTKLDTYLVHQKIWNPIDFQGQKSRPPGHFFLPHITLMNTLESISFHEFWPLFVIATDSLSATSRWWYFSTLKWINIIIHTRVDKYHNLLVAVGAFISIFRRA